MKESMSGIKSRLKTNKGEILIETLISFFILAILMAAVTTAINNSMHVTGSSVQRGRVVQEVEVNTAILTNYWSETETGITFTGNGINVMHDIRLNARCFDATNPDLTYPGCRCDRYPQCAVLPCASCCGCNEMRAFAPKVTP
jgi:Tfp pilus assembly protein PilV